MSNTEESTGSQSRSSTGSFNTSRSEKTISEKISKGRLKKQLKQIANDPLPGISVGLKDGNIYKWEAAVQGPPDSPYEGGMFLLEISFSESFPFQPPKVTFKTKIYHFNINSKGEIGLDILRKTWTPASKVHDVLQSIYSHLTCYDPLSTIDLQQILNHIILFQFMVDREAYDKTCKEWTKKFATKKSP